MSEKPEKRLVRKEQKKVGVWLSAIVCLGLAIRKWPPKRLVSQKQYRRLPEEKVVWVWLRAAILLAIGVVILVNIKRTFGDWDWPWTCYPGLLIIAIWCITLIRSAGKSVRDAIIMERVARITGQNAHLLPAQELLRSSDLPPTVHQSELLRATQAGQETPQEELLRASTGEE